MFEAYLSLMLRLFKKRSHTEFKAVSSDDLESYLGSIGMLNDIKTGRHRCKSCGDIITLANLQALIPNKGNVEFLCSRALCVKNIDR